MYSLVLVAAGTGSRLGLGYNKVLYHLKNGLTILETTLNIFENLNIFNEIIIVINKEDIDEVQNILRNKDNVKITTGGSTRGKSVYNGVLECTNDYVFIHDSARCNIKGEIILELKNAIKDNIPCITLGVPPKDTIGITNENILTDMLERDKLVSIQTPQVINKNTYFECYIDGENTDETSLFIEKSKEVMLINGCYENFKITTREDLEYYEYLKFIKR